VNEQFEQLSQMHKESLNSKSFFDVITDQALMQNIEALIAKRKSLLMKNTPIIIPFSQFECTISIQASLGPTGEPEYYVLTLAQN
jgi:hypothetical protein